MNHPRPEFPAPAATGCHACSAPIEVLTAPWCECLSKQISLICATCGSCHCKASDRIVRDFWNNASDELVARRTDEQKRRSAVARNRSAAAELLIVDDDEDMRLADAYMVQQMGYSVATASNGEEALTTIAANAPRIVITDALMPRLDGRQLCRCIKALDSSIKVVIMTSLYTSPRYKYEAYRQFKADEYLAKPIEFPLLEAILHKVDPVGAQVSR